MNSLCLLLDYKFFNKHKSSTIIILKVAFFLFSRLNFLDLGTKKILQT